MRSKIRMGVWLQGVAWKMAPDGRVLVDIEGYERWAEGCQSINRGGQKKSPALRGFS